jgi:hypothetical protein
MLAPASSTPSAFSDEYRRRARKLRAQHAHDIATLHKALSDLAQEADQHQPPAQKPEGPATAFAQLVAQELEGPILRYSKRQALIREAERRGIGRFEANLIIAAVQHQAGRAAPLREAKPDDSSHWRTAIAACAVQGLIFLAMYLLLFT